MIFLAYNSINMFFFFLISAVVSSFIIIILLLVVTLDKLLLFYFAIDDCVCVVFCWSLNCDVFFSLCLTFYLYTHTHANELIVSYLRIILSLVFHDSSIVFH